MFDRIKKTFSSRAVKDEGDAATPSQLAHGPMSEWAGTQGFAVSLQGDGQTVALEGKVGGGRQWRLEAGPPRATTSAARSCARAPTCAWRASPR
ncbi:hypothetical protein [Ramlibacter sp.]|uniref:hypothetical protein n=1 Tax=Ramlibacter sp. TaxID=1917967 RepID=UPI0025F0B4C3|nr:hypothetical protein [Ramlibacter sp.]